MKNILMVLWVMAAFVLGCYVGLFVCFVGGIVDLIEQVKLPFEEISSFTIAFAIVKILFSALAGYVTFIVSCIPVAFLVDTAARKREVGLDEILDYCNRKSGKRWP